MRILELSTPAEIALMLGQRVRVLRLARDLSQKELAARAGLSLTMLRRLESRGESPLLAWVKVMQVLQAEDSLNDIINPPQCSIADLESQSRQRASRLTPQSQKAKKRNA